MWPSALHPRSHLPSLPFSSLNTSKFLKHFYLICSFEFLHKTHSMWKCDTPSGLVQRSMCGLFMCHIWLSGKCVCMGTQAHGSQRGSWLFYSITSYPFPSDRVSETHGQQSPTSSCVSLPIIALGLQTHAITPSIFKASFLCYVHGCFACMCLYTMCTQYPRTVEEGVR